MKIWRREALSWGGWLVVAWVVSSPTSVQAIAAKPASEAATWGADTWGIIRALPAIVKPGKQVHLHAMVVGGPASDPFWSCSQYSGWLANGTATVAVTVPGPWDMPHTGSNIFGEKVNMMTRDGGEKPPYGWENRISDTCYCYVDTWGAHGGCESREVQPILFQMMDQFNPREGNVQFATVLSGSGWTAVSGYFEGYVGVVWGDFATEYVYVADDNALTEDSDHDGLPDAWEYAHSPNQSLDDFSGGTTLGATRMRPEQAAAAWINPYAPGEPGWVSAGPNDWDGDGVTNKQEYEKWNTDEMDPEGLPYSPIFINSRKTFPYHLFLPAIQGHRTSHAQAGVCEEKPITAGRPLP